MEIYWIASAIFFAAWAICGYLAYGYEYAYQTRFQWFTMRTERQCREIALSFCWMGFFSLAILYFSGETRYGRLYPWQDTLTRSERKK